MPVLAEQTSLFPDDLLQVPLVDDSPDLAIQQEDERVWWVLYTKSRQEKAVARDLLGYRLPFYLPQVQKDSIVRGRRVPTYVPVFPGYVFLYGSPEERVQSLKTNRISRILEVTRQEELAEDLRQLANLIAIGAPLTVEQRLAPGRRVRIRNGPIAGFEGTIVRRRGADRLLIAVNFLQQGVSIEINDFMVEPI